MLLLDAWRKLKLLRDDATEHLQRSLTILWAKGFPEVLQGYPLALARCRRKKVPSWPSRMVILLEWCVAWTRTNPRASKKRRPTIQESSKKGQSGSIGVLYVYAF